MTDELEILQNKHQKKLKERKSKIRYFYTSKFIKPLNDEFEYKSHDININTALKHHKAFIRIQDIEYLQNFININNCKQIKEFPKFNEEDRIIEFNNDETVTEYICSISLKGLRMLHGDLITVLTKEEKEFKDEMEMNYLHRAKSHKIFRYKFEYMVLLTTKFRTPKDGYLEFKYDTTYDFDSDYIKRYLQHRNILILKDESEYILNKFNIKQYQIIDEYPELTHNSRILEINPNEKIKEYIGLLTLEGLRKL